MARHVVFVVSSRPARLDVRLATVRDVGYWPLPAPTIDRALSLAAKVRPSLILIDPELSDGRAIRLVESLRAIPALPRVRIVVLGELTPVEHDAVARDPLVHVRPILDGNGLRGLLTALLEGRDANSVAPAP